VLEWGLDLMLSAGVGAVFFWNWNLAEVSATYWSQGSG
jgi:hypothetical protein